VTSERQGAVVRLVPSGPFNLDHAPAVQRALATAEEGLEVGEDVVLDLRDLDHLDGSGAVLLARLLTRMGSGLSLGVTHGWGQVSVWWFANTRNFLF